MNFDLGIELIMPLCDGRPPDGVCPDRKNDRSVVLCQGDLMLCEACEHDRFPDCSRKSLKRKKAQSTASRQLTASVSAGRSESSDDTAGTSVGITGGSVLNSKDDGGGDNSAASMIMANGCITPVVACDNKPEISEVLCFLSNKFHNYPLTMIKKAMLEFYRDEEISAAKLLLIQCISDKGLDVQQYTKNRIGLHKNKSALDDICSMWSLIDESVGTINMPTFCAADLSRIPVLCDEMSDIAVIKKSVMDLENQVKALSAGLSEIKNPRLYDEMFPPMPSSEPACPSTASANTDQVVTIDNNSNNGNNDVHNYSDAVRCAPIVSDTEQFRTVTTKKNNNNKICCWQFYIQSVSGPASEAGLLRQSPATRNFC